MAPSGTRRALPPPVSGERVIWDGNQAVLQERATSLMYRGGWASPCPQASWAEGKAAHHGQARIWGPQRLAWSHQVPAHPERQSWTQLLPAETRPIFFYT